MLNLCNNIPCEIKSGKYYWNTGQSRTFNICYRTQSNWLRKIWNSLCTLLGKIYSYSKTGRYTYLCSCLQYAWHYYLPLFWNHDANSLEMSNIQHRWRLCQIIL